MNRKVVVENGETKCIKEGRCDRKIDKNLYGLTRRGPKNGHEKTEGRNPSGEGVNLGQRRVYSVRITNG